MIEAAEAVRRARARPRAARADERQHGHLARARREAQGLPAHVRDAGERDRGAQAAAAPLRRGRSSTRRAPRARTVPCALALELAEREPKYFMPFQYANEANPRAHYEGTGAEIAEALDRVDVVVAGLGTGGTLMGTGERLRESFPDVVVAAAEPLPGDPVMGLRSLEDGYVPPILDVSKLDRKVLVSNEESVASVRRCSTRTGIFAGVSAGAVVPRRPQAREPSSTKASSSRSSRTAAGSTCPPTSGTPTTSSRRWSERSGGDPRRGARAARAHAQRRGAERSVRARVAARRPRRALRAGTQRRLLAVPLRARVRRPEHLVRRGRGLRARRLPLAPLGAARPSRTDVENIGLWAGKPYLVYSIGKDDLAAFRIEDGQIEELPVTQ